MHRKHKEIFIENVTINTEKNNKYRKNKYRKNKTIKKEYFNPYQIYK